MIWKIPQILAAMYKLLLTFNPAVRAILFAGSTVTAVVAFMGGLWNQVFLYVDQLVVATIPTLDFTPLSLANYFLPLDTALDLLVAYGALRLICVAIRMIKAWIPTVS